VERWFATLTEKQIRRGAHQSSSPQQAAGYELRFSKQPVSNRPTSQAAGNATRRDSTRQLEDAIRRYLDIYNAEPQPFIWTKSADDIMTSIERFCLQISNSGHLRR
jgi:hypothetical protein